MGDFTRLMDKEIKIKTIFSNEREINSSSHSLL
jgi:hypothetical protein